MHFRQQKNVDMNKNLISPTTYMYNVGISDEAGKVAYH